MSNNRYMFVINYEQIKNGRKVNYEHVERRGSINNQWFLMADCVIDTKEQKTIKNRKNILNSKQILSTYKTN